MSLIYDEQETVRQLTSPAGPGMPLSAERGLFRQDPGPGGILDPQGRDAQFRVAKVAAGDLAALSAQDMADRLAREIDHPKEPNTSGLVAIDEIGNTFNDGRARITHKWWTVRGKRIKLASQNSLVVTRTGYRIVRGPAPVPEVKPDSPGARLSAALAILAGMPHAGGGSYADRVHVYVAPAFVTSIALGRGPHRHLGNDGKPHRAAWRGVMPALASAGGVWLEMYHYTRAGGLTSLTAREWRVAPGAFARYHARFGGDGARLHMLMSQAPARPPGAAASCGEPMACQWRLAESTGAGRSMLANGPGAYRLGSQAGEWRAEFNRLLTP
jgi:hypothetical protein